MSISEDPKETIILYTGLIIEVPDVLLQIRDVI
jgi:hypothetical protein